MSGVYVHLPFCPYLCPYCDFAKWPMRPSAAGQYLAALNAEIDAAPQFRAETLFVGGGTPNAYDAPTLAELLQRLQRFGPYTEATIEINPDLVREGDFERYREAGITRASIGVQSLQPTEIATLGRRHSVDDVARAIAQTRKAGFTSISVDLIFAVPGQTAESWRDSLRSTIELRPDHVSAYGLTVEEGTPFYQWQRRDPHAFFDDTSEAQLYAIAIQELHAAGYEQYEISNFARPGHRCAHNENYWSCGEYLGLGVGAASYLGGERRIHTRSLEAYVESALRGSPIPAERERLEGFKRVGEAIMLALRTSQGVGLRDFKERYGIDVARHYAPVVSRYSQAGLLERIGDCMRLTERGRFLANDVCGAFVTFD